MKFKPPDTKEQLRAIGELKGLPEKLQQAFNPQFDFQPIPPPQPGDWLDIHPEPGQTFREYIKLPPPKPASEGCKIYLQPLGEFNASKSPSLEILRDYAKIYFGLPTEILPPLNLNSLPITSRKNPFTGRKQILTTDVLNISLRNLPHDAFSLLAITMEDLYPEPSWNFVFGQAFLSQRVGVFSFARYDPAFYGYPREKDYLRVLRQRSCKVLVHELGHMFYLAHCIYFRCVMNGSNHIGESDSRPLHLCPVCLRKLHFCLEFDIEKRYEELLLFYRQQGFIDEAEWVATRLKRIRH
ncbi:MAG: archaemetzincin [Thermodesulfobacteriota bacterium]